MKATELISRLVKLIQEHGDLEVVLYCDHGQTQSESRGVSKEMLEDHPEKASVFEIYGE